MSIVSPALAACLLAVTLAGSPQLSIIEPKPHSAFVQGYRSLLIDSNHALLGHAVEPIRQSCR